MLSRRRPSHPAATPSTAPSASCWANIGRSDHQLSVSPLTISTSPIVRKTAIGSLAPDSSSSMGWIPPLSPAPARAQDGEHRSGVGRRHDRAEQQADLERHVEDHGCGHTPGDHGRDGHAERGQHAARAPARAHDRSTSGTDAAVEEDERERRHADALGRARRRRTRCPPGPSDPASMPSPGRAAGRARRAGWRAWTPARPREDRTAAASSTGSELSTSDARRLRGRSVVVMAGEATEAPAASVPAAPAPGPP